MDETDILPCPFCGNQPKVEMTGFHLGGRTIRCEAIDCMGPHTTAACVEDAVVQWNRRAATQTPTSKSDVAPKIHGDVIEALTQAEECFENLSDVVDGSYGEPAPNREMSLAQLCRDALQRVE